MNFKQLSRREQTLVGGTAILVFLFANVLLYQWWNITQETRAHLEPLVEKKTTRQRLIADLPKELEELKKYATPEKLDSPHSRSREVWERHILALTSQSGFMVNRIKAKRLEGSDENAYAVSVDGSGSFEKFVRFLELLMNDETYPRILSCDVRSNTGVDIVNVNIDICTKLAPKRSTSTAASPRVGRDAVAKES